MTGIVRVTYDVQAIFHALVLQEDKYFAGLELCHQIDQFLFLFRAQWAATLFEAVLHDGTQVIVQQLWVHCQLIHQSLVFVVKAFDDQIRRFFAVHFDDLFEADNHRVFDRFFFFVRQCRWVELAANVVEELQLCKRLANQSSFAEYTP